MRFSAASRKHIARDCLNLYPKYTKTRLRASVSSKNFPGVISPDPRFKGEEGRPKGRGNIMNGRKGMDRKDEGEGRRRRGEGGYN
jgi:hypothetical protein